LPKFSGKLEPVTFLKYFKGQKHFAGLAKKLAAPPGEKIHLHGIIGSAKTILTANLFRNSAKTWCSCSTTAKKPPIFSMI
jgi:hypothetical protein